MRRSAWLFRGVLALAAMVLLSACYTSSTSLIPSSRSFTPITPGSYCEYTFDSQRADWGACTRISLTRGGQNEYSYYRPPSAGSTSGTSYTVRILNTALTGGAFRGDYPAQACSANSCYLAVARVFSSSEMQILLPNCSSTQTGGCSLYSVSDMITRFSTTNSLAVRYKYVRVGG